MKTKISVMWVEDQEIWLEPKIEQIQSFLDGFGIFLEVKKFGNIKEAHDEVSKDLKHDFDFVFVDFNLDKLNNNGEGISGATLIEIFRKKNKFVEVLFYSNAVDFREKISKDIDGIFTVGRDDFYVKVTQLIEFYIEKVINIATVRNHIISEVAHIDNILVDILSDMFVKRPEYKEEFFEAAASGSQDRTDELKGNLAEFKKITTIDELIPLLIGPKFQSDDYRKGVQRIRNNLNLFPEHKTQLNEYSKVLGKRNLYAHCEVKEQGGVKVLVSHNPKKAPDIFTVKDSVNFALEIESFKNNFLELGTKLKQIK